MHLILVFAFILPSHGSAHIGVRNVHRVNVAAPNGHVMRLTESACEDPTLPHCATRQYGWGERPLARYEGGYDDISGDIYNFGTSPMIVTVTRRF